MVPRHAPTPALPHRGREKFGVRVLPPRPFGERAGERGTREETVVLRGAPTMALALAHWGREELRPLSNIRRLGYTVSLSQSENATHSQRSIMPVRQHR